MNCMLYVILSHGGQAAVPMFWTCSVTKSMKAYTKLRVAGSFHRERMSKHVKTCKVLPSYPTNVKAGP